MVGSSWPSSRVLPAGPLASLLDRPALGAWTTILCPSASRPCPSWSSGWCSAARSRPWCRPGGWPGRCPSGRWWRCQRPGSPGWPYPGVSAGGPDRRPADRPRGRAGGRVRLHAGRAGHQPGRPGVDRGRLPRRARGGRRPVPRLAGHRGAVGLLWTRLGREDWIDRTRQRTVEGETRWRSCIQTAQHDFLQPAAGS